MKYLTRSAEMDWTPLVAAAIVLAVLLPVAVARSAAAEKTPSERFGMEVRIVAAEQAGRYECTAVITDLATDTVLSAPRVTFRAGDDAQIRSGNAPGITVDIVVGVNQEETEARYSASIRRDQTVLSSQTVTTALGGARKSD